jgi:acyl-CoA synthetase (AMP-forming)/AMP-acid ligase II
VVAFQLPNWMEAGAVYWAAAYLGAVAVPIVHFYGAKEVGYILDVTNPKVVVSADEFGRIDYLALYEGLLVDRPEITWLVVDAVGAPLPSSAELLSATYGADPIVAALPVDPRSPAVIGFTSGTTRNPRGVVHSHQTLGFEARQLHGGANPRPTLTGAPVGHFMGMLAAFLLPLVHSKPVHLIDVWDPAEVLRAMLADDLGAGGGSSFFLTSLLDHPEFTDEHAASMPYLGLGGAPVPEAVTARAAALGIQVYRSYGSTEHPSVTGSTVDTPEVKRHRTDGRPMEGVEVRLETFGETSSHAGAGEILTRGPDRFLGYTDAELTAAAIDGDGWYRTGDVGVLDEDGYLLITDRLSDVIIRGGENISAQEIEDVLIRHSGVAEAIVVSAPDERLGEHAAAVLRLREGFAAPTLAEVGDHLASAGLARQKVPESLYVVEDLPRTPSGKVQKFRLREQLRAGMLSGGEVR